MIAKENSITFNSKKRWNRIIIKFSIYYNKLLDLNPFFNYKNLLQNGNFLNSHIIYFAYLIIKPINNYYFLIVFKSRFTYF